MRFSAHRSAVSPTTSQHGSAPLVKEYCANFCTVKMGCSFFILLSVGLCNLSVATGNVLRFCSACPNIRIETEICALSEMTCLIVNA